MLSDTSESRPESGRATVQTGPGADAARRRGPRYVVVAASPNGPPVNAVGLAYGHGDHVRRVAAGGGNGLGPPLSQSHR